MKRLHGLTVALLTPFDENGHPLYEEMGKLADWLIKRGVDCLYPCGTTGMGPVLRTEERKQLALSVVRSVGGRKPVFIHTGANTYEETLQLTKHACDIGADGAGIVTPYFFKMNDSEMVAYYKDIARNLPADFPLYLYNIPQLSGNDLTVKVVDKLAQECPNIIGIKYSQPNMERAQAYTFAREDFSVLMGTDSIIGPCLTTGLDGIVSGTACAFPEALKALFTAATRKAPGLRKVEKHVMEINSATHSGNIPYLAAALKIRGCGNGYVTKPLQPIEGAEYEALREKILALGEV